MKGVAGAIGKGGHRGGNETHNVQSIDVVKYTKFSSGFWGSRRKSCEMEIQNVVDGMNPAGKDGIDNYVTAGMESAVLEFNRPSLAIIGYKSFARERLIGSSRQIALTDFLDKVTNDGKFAHCMAPWI